MYLIKKITFLLVTCVGIIYAYDKPQIHIIFEAYCPASARFMEYNLKPSYSPLLKDHLDIIFIPFGKVTKISGPEKYYCQHGPEECRLNKIMSCALYFLNDQEQQVKYVICSMKMEDQWMKCTENTSLVIDNVMKCYNKTSLGSELQSKAAGLQNEVLKKFPEDIPSIVIDRQSDTFLNKIAFTDFRRAVCVMLHDRYDTKWDNKLIEYCTYD